MTTYLPVCPACRNNLPVFYIGCQGCTARRAVAMAEYHANDRAGLPAASRPKPQP